MRPERGAGPTSMATPLTIKSFAGNCWHSPGISISGFVAMCRRRILLCLIVNFISTAALNAQDARLTLQALVTPSTVVLKDGRPVTFAIHAFIEFKSLA